MQTLTELTEGPDHPTSTEKSTTPWAKSRCDRADNPLTPIPQGLWKQPKMALLSRCLCCSLLTASIFFGITSMVRSRQNTTSKTTPNGTLWENYSLEWGDFPPILVIINLLLSTQNVNVASLTILSETFSHTVQCGKISEENSALIFFSWSKK